ncbi:pci domain-containing protein, partial [Cystoisospora suis]
MGKELVSPSIPPSQSSTTGKPPASSSSPNGGEKKPSPSSSSSPLLLLCLALQQIQEGVSQQDERPIIRMFRQLKRLRATCQIRHLQLAANHLLWGADLSSSTSTTATKSTGDSPPQMASKREDGDEEAEDKEGQRTHLNGSGGAAGGGGDGSVCLNEEKRVHYRREIDGDTAAFWNFLKNELDRMLHESKKDQMQVDGAVDKDKLSSSSSAFPLAASDFLICTNEVESFLSLLFLLRLIDEKHYPEASLLGDALVRHILNSSSSSSSSCNTVHSSSTSANKAEEAGEGEKKKSLSPSSASANVFVVKKRRRLDSIVAKCFFYWYRARELGKTVLDHSVRETLLAAYTVASVQHHPLCQATFLNLLLRDYISQSQYELALKLISKTCFPENLRSNAQHARYLYYLGTIQAVRLEYSAAFSKLQMALRKAPQHPHVASGFKLAALKKSIVVELLMGDIPERSIFNRKETRSHLLPYKHIVLAVRSGDLHSFSTVMKKYESVFIRDKTLFLIRRLHHNVIRAGLRLISLSYSRISL